MNDEEELMQVIRITIEGIVYDMYSPVVIKSNDEIGQIEQIEFGEIIETKHLVGFLLQYINNSGARYDRIVH